MPSESGYYLAAESCEQAEGIPERVPYLRRPLDLYPDIDTCIGCI